MMEAKQQFENLRDAGTCCICWEYFTDPVSLECEHSFCCSCITSSWQAAGPDPPGPDPPCPLCRIRSRGRYLRPNWQLRVIVDFISRNVPPAEGPLEEGLCPKHLQKLELFCADDHKILCVICRESWKHKLHTVAPMEEVAQVYRNILHGHMEQLNAELRGLEELRTEGSRIASQLKKDFKIQVERICRTFQTLKRGQERVKRLLLSRMEQEHWENLQKIRWALTHLEEQLTARRELVAEMETKCEHPDVELLTDVHNILRWCDSVNTQNPKGDSEMDQNPTPSPRQQVWNHEVIMDTFPVNLGWTYVKEFECEVHLDPDTAHRSLVLSQDGRSVRDGGRAQELPDTLARFNPVCYVLGRQKLSSGRHYWEVEVGDATGWGLGVCDESVSRKGSIALTPEKGYWLVTLFDGEYYALTSASIPLTPNVPPRKVGFFLDYDTDRLSVYNAEDKSLLFTFTGTGFPRTLRPLFWPQFCDGKKPAAALRILPVTVQG